MIDKFFFWFFGKIDDWSCWVFDRFICDKPKKPKKKKPSNDDLFNGEQMEMLLDKIGFLLLPKNFAAVFPLCLWYWIVLTAIFYWVMRGRK